MAQQPLKRTFHGCLTCRRRKVRCPGGNPCQHCSRMNIECQSPFDANLKIRVSTPSGQKDLDTKSQNPNKAPVPTPEFNTTPPPDILDDDAASWVAYPPQDLQYQYQPSHLASTFGHGLSSFHPTTASSSFGSGALGLDSCQYLGPWDLTDPSFNTPYPHAAVDVLETQMTDPAYFGMPNLLPPSHQHLESMPCWETASFPSAQGSEKFREEWWIPGIVTTSGRTS